MDVTAPTCQTEVKQTPSRKGGSIFCGWIFCSFNFVLLFFASEHKMEEMVEQLTAATDVGQVCNSPTHHDMPNYTSPKSKFV